MSPLRSSQSTVLRCLWRQSSHPIGLRSSQYSRSLCLEPTFAHHSSRSCRVLTDVKIQDASSLRQALRTLHETYHVPNVVISSIPLTPWLRELLPTSLKTPTDAKTPYLACIASSKTSEGSLRVHAKCFPCLPGYFSGVGDPVSRTSMGTYFLFLTRSSTTASRSGSQTMRRRLPTT